MILFIYDKSLTCLNIDFLFGFLLCRDVRWKKVAFFPARIVSGLDFFCQIFELGSSFRKPQVMPGATFRTTRKLSRTGRGTTFFTRFDGSCSTTYYHWIHNIVCSSILSYTPYILQNMFN